MKHYPLVRSTGIEPACPGDTRSLVLRVCQFRHDRISVFSRLIHSTIFAELLQVLFLFFEKNILIKPCPFGFESPHLYAHNKTGTLKDACFVMVRSKGFEPPWSPTRT